jgi:hypothetical protein
MEMSGQLHASAVMESRIFKKYAANLCKFSTFNKNSTSKCRYISVCCGHMTAFHFLFLKLMSCISKALKRS